MLQLSGQFQFTGPLERETEWKLPVNNMSFHCQELYILALTRTLSVPVIKKLCQRRRIQNNIEWISRNHRFTPPPPPPTHLFSPTLSWKSIFSPQTGYGILWGYSDGCWNVVYHFNSWKAQLWHPHSASFSQRGCIMITLHRSHLILVPIRDGCKAPSCFFLVCNSNTTHWLNK